MTKDEYHELCREGHTHLDDGTVIRVEDLLTQEQRTAIKEWHELHEIVKQMTRDNTLHIHLRMNYNGAYITRDAVVDMNALKHMVTAPECIGNQCSQYMQAMTSAIERM